MHKTHIQSAHISKSSQYGLTLSLSVSWLEWDGSDVRISERCFIVLPTAWRQLNMLASFEPSRAVIEQSRCSYALLYGTSARIITEMRSLAPGDGIVRILLYSICFTRSAHTVNFNQTKVKNGCPRTPYSDVFGHLSQIHCTVRCMHAPGRGVFAEK